MPAPTVTSLPTAPSRGDAPAQFNSRADAWVAAIDNFTDEINALAAYLGSTTATSGPIDETNLTMATSRLLGRTTASEGGIEELTAAQVRALLGVSNLALPTPLTFNFSDAADALFYADEAMTLTQQATSGTLTIAYEKSTSAAPSTFSSTTSPISLEAGAWLKVSATSVTAPAAVHLKRTA